MGLPQEAPALLRQPHFYFRRMGKTGSHGAYFKKMTVKVKS